MSNETIVCICAELTRNWSAEDRAAMCGHHLDCPLFTSNFQASIEKRIKPSETEAKLAVAEAALAKINDIRNSIIGCQRVSWSEHIYPLVAVLDEAGVPGLEYDEARLRVATLLERLTAADDKLAIAVAALKDIAAKPLWGVEERVKAALEAIDAVKELP